MNNKVLVILLNWNGSKLTLDCCESLSKNEHKNTDVLVIDNASTNDDFDVLYNGLVDLTIEKSSFPSSERIDSLIENYNIKSLERFSYSSDMVLFLAKSAVNHGFSRGCNFGALLAQAMDYSHILLLNNDTVVEPDFLTKLFLYNLNANIVIPQIRYFEPATVIWNCGGKISKFGTREYYFANERVSEAIFPTEPFAITFATGCCMLMTTSFYIASGMFTEDFFFGEEDVDYALRLKKLNAKVLCVPDSIIYHKVGASLAGDLTKLRRKAHIHYLNRFINMKNHLGLLWCLWLTPATLKMYINMRKIYKLSTFEGIFFCLKVLKASMLKNKVEKKYFEKIMTHGY